MGLLIMGGLSKLVLYKEKAHITSASQSPLIKWNTSGSYYRF